jgi:hypothetical protein
MLSARARVSISSTSVLHPLGLGADVVRPAGGLFRERRGDSISSALERITVSGVLSSWEASERN